MESDKDFWGLGRWAWTRYRGRNNISLRVIAIYQLVLNCTGVMSVRNQQKSYLKLIQEDQCPREMFVHNLVGNVVKWLETCDQLGIGGDVNEDV
jgi:hypothetical protein